MEILLNKYILHMILYFLIKERYNQTCNLVYIHIIIIFILAVDRKLFTVSKKKKNYEILNISKLN